MTRPRSRRPAPARPDGDPLEAARAAGLHYVADDGPGIRRIRAGSGFTYRAPDGSRIDDPRVIERIRALAIPPAWTRVWICPDPSGHVQATGRDAKGRKQYRYHPRWRNVRDESKYARMLGFARALPALRRRVDADLRRPGLHREKVLAAVVRLLDETLLRVGNESYARSNGSFGLTTLRDRHVAIRGATIRLSFRAKAGRRQVTGLRDRRLARVLRRARDVPGRRLFQYRADDGSRQPIESGDVNAYIRDAMGADFTAKDFRTWAGTYLALAALRATPGFRSRAEQKRRVVEAVKEVAAALGNTPAVARASYIHHAVIEAYADGSAVDATDRSAPPRDGLGRMEQDAVALLEARVADGS